MERDRDEWTTTRVCIDTIPVPFTDHYDRDTPTHTTHNNKKEETATTKQNKQTSTLTKRKNMKKGRKEASAWAGHKHTAYGALCTKKNKKKNDRMAGLGVFPLPPCDVRQRTQAG